jgi:branched-chain amino acid transport system permease protein
MNARPRWFLSLPAAAITAIIVYAAVYRIILPNELALLNRMAIMALFVLSLDLVVGYCGVVTLGHMALFGSGAYAAAISANAGVNSPLELLLLGAAAGGLSGLISGALILRARGFSQLVLSIAIVQLMQALANKAQRLTGGSDGLSGIEPAAIFGLFRFDIYGRTASALAIGLLVSILIVLIRVVRSPFGLTCQAIRQEEGRVRAMGVSVFPRLLTMFTLSGVVAGVAGALSAVSTGVVALDSLSFEKSAEALVMLILGGRGTLFGGVLGAAVFVWFEHFFANANPFHWTVLLGLLLITVVLVLPNGLIGLTSSWRSLRDRNYPSKASTPS